MSTKTRLAKIEGTSANIVMSAEIISFSIALLKSVALTATPESLTKILTLWRKSTNEHFAQNPALHDVLLQLFADFES